MQTELDSSLVKYSLVYTFGVKVYPLETSEYEKSKTKIAQV